MSTDETEVCGRCGGDDPLWFAPNPLWNAVEKEAGYSFLCPNCFGWCAEQAGIKTGAWVFTDEVAGYDAAALLAYAVGEIARMASDAHEAYRLGERTAAA